MPGLKTLFGSAMLALLCLPVSDASAEDLPWCAIAGGRNSYENCGYYTLEQCRAAVSGVGGNCRPNPRYRFYSDPYYDEPPPPRRRRYAPY